ncbi:aspartyl protease family protein [Mucilaginibacter sp. RS28]|uniref:Aspartyl protease family protein n=1 Tax=Mucilaginibacter straminoryzae TaxID=2932774 RepID=A0A9X2BCE9_9SPHI|nr:aspartyl protease family protein [Mucilaginibacter straminoryzae]MCJ8210857.1 aspartyl protease family protein [Mucilaginibacter straminoryzae]
MVMAYAANAQFFELPEGKKRVVVPFKLVRNLLIVSVRVGGRGPFNFIVDSGVGIIVITDPAMADSARINTKRRIQLSGLGEGSDLEASIASGLTFDIDGVRGSNLSAAVLNKDQFGLSNYAGMPVHGLIGYDLFNSLAVKLSFSDTTITLARPGSIKEFKRGYKIPIKIEQNKPYIEAGVNVDGKSPDVARLLIDFGAGHPLMLENALHKLPQDRKFIQGNLGIGLTGPVNGLLSRVDELDIGKYKFKDVITSLPFDNPQVAAKDRVNRDGSIGLGILNRFAVIMDYQNNMMYLKPSGNYKKPFEHDMSGLEYYADGKDLHTIVISRVEPGSAADDIGLRKDDIITAVNFKPVAEMTIQDIDNIFKSYNDRSLLLDIFRDKKRQRFILTLKRRI